MIVRTADAGDLPEIARISEANDEPVGDQDRLGSRYLEHLLRHARLLVAEADAGIVGFAGTIDIPAGRFLTDLFVDPPGHGRGIGRALLAAALPADGPRLTFSSSDPRALPIYVRAGLSPWWPLLYLEAPPGGTQRDPGWPTVEPVEVAEAAALELALIGSDRSRDWTFWAAAPGHVPFRVVDGGRPLAVGFSSPPRLGRLAIGRDGDPVGVLLASVASGPGGPLTGIAIPGPHPATRALLELGWRIVGHDVYMASGPDLLDPTRLLPDESLA